MTDDNDTFRPESLPDSEKTDTVETVSGDDLTAPEPEGMQDLVSSLLNGSIPERDKHHIDDIEPVDPEDVPEMTRVVVLAGGYSIPEHYWDRFGRDDRKILLSNANIAGQLAKRITKHEENHGRPIPGGMLSFDDSKEEFQLEDGLTAEEIAGGNIKQMIEHHRRQIRNLSRLQSILPTSAEPEADQPSLAERPLLIGLGGKYQSGKDALADHLVANYGFVKMNYSDALHEFLMIQNPWVSLDEEVLRTQGRILTEELSENGWRYRDVVEWFGYVGAKKHSEVRRLLQATGTDAGREFLGEDTWVNLLIPRINEALASGTPVIVTRLSYQNELDAIEVLGGTSVYVKRPEAQAVVEPEVEMEDVGHTSSGVQSERLTGETVLDAIDTALKAHSSENSLTEADFERVLNNEGTLEDLARLGDELVSTLFSQRRGTYQNVKAESFPPAEASPEAFDG